VSLRVFFATPENQRADMHIQKSSGLGACSNDRTEPHMELKYQKPPINTISK